MTPAFAITHETAPAVADICVRLDGLPLALELAAARIRVLSPQAMLSRLDHRLMLATGGTRDLPARQQTLRATIDWSYHLLTPDEQILFARLAVFVSGSLDAVEAVCNADGTLDVLGGLESLVAQSLLRAEEGVEEEPRFRMLETIHEYAWERLEASGEADALRRRHAASFLALAETGEQALHGCEQVVWLRRLEQEHDNLRAALGWAQASGAHEMGLRLVGALWLFWWIRGYLSEGRRSVENFVDGACEPEVIAPQVQAKTLFVAALFAELLSDYDQAEARYAHSLRLAEAAGAMEVCALALCGLGLVASERGEHTQTTARYEQSLAIFRTLGNQWGCAGLLSNLAWVAQEQGDYARAVALNQEGLRVNREVGDRWVRAFLLRNLGDVARLQGDAAHATALYEQSVALSREVGDNEIVASCLMNLGAVAVAQGEPARATALYQESLLLHRTMGSIEHVGESLEGLAGAVGGLAQPQRAARLFGAASTARTVLGTPRPPAEGAAYDRHVAAVRVALGEEEFARAWAEGQAMTLEQAIAYAIEDGPRRQL